MGNFIKIILIKLNIRGKIIKSDKLNRLKFIKIAWKRWKITSIDRLIF